LSTVPLAATPLWAALLALLYLVLAAQVIRARYRTRTALGTGNDPGLERAIRAHANFAEYVPLTLILLTLAELQGAAPWLLHLLGAMLLIGRAVHAYGISQTEEVLIRRSAGVALTFGVLVTATLANLVLFAA
jgi:uncharacterized membrane protein YecN with MAPEG domain